jgi:hypothetical protein
MFYEFKYENEAALKKNKPQQNDKEKDDSIIIKNKKVKIGLLEGQPYIMKDSLNNIEGFEYEIVREFIKHHNIDDETIYLKGDKSWNEYIQDLADGEYDMLIGVISQSYERTKIINFSQPLAVDILSIFYKKDNENTSTKYVYKMLITILEIIGLILIVGFFISFIHYYSSNFKTTFKESLWRVWSALLGEPGLGVNPTKFNDNVAKASNLNLGVRALLILLSALFGIYITSLVTSERLADISKNKPFEKIEQLIGKNILVIGDRNDEDLLRRYQKLYDFKITTIEEGEGNDYETLKNYYLENKDKLKLDGFFETSEEFYYFNKDETIVKGDIVLEKGLISAAFNKKNINLLIKFNKTISMLREKKYIHELCGKYFKNEDVCVQ